MIDILNNLTGEPGFLVAVLAGLAPGLLVYQ
jgi:hypothetical protein